MSEYTSKYTIDVSTDGILSWSIDIKNIDHDDLQKFVAEITSHKFIKILHSNKWVCDITTKTADIKSIDSFNLVLTKYGRKYLDIIKNFICSEKKEVNENFIEIKVENSYQRKIIYMICIIFGLSCKKIEGVADIIVPCSIYSPYNKSKSYEERIDKCGCDYAPKKFHKHHYENDYEDTISYSKFRCKTKVAIRIYKNIENS
jgi:hypothetical protein